MVGSGPAPRLSSPAVFKILLLAFAASGWALPEASRASGDIIYTWHDDDNGGTSGYLEVKSAAQTDGGFSLADVVGFTFHAPDTNYNYPFLSLSPGTIHISMSNAGFTSSSSEIISGNALATITLPINSMYDVIGGEHWSSSGYDGHYSGVGHWTITGAASIPEPSALALLAIGLATLAGVKLARAKAGRAPFLTR